MRSFPIASLFFIFISPDPATLGLKYEPVSSCKPLERGCERESDNSVRVRHTAWFPVPPPTLSSLLVAASVHTEDAQPDIFLSQTALFLPGLDPEVCDVILGT